MKQLAHNIINDSLTIVYGNEVYTTNKTNPNWLRILEALENNDGEEAVRLINTKEAILEYMDDIIEIRGGELFYQDEKMGGMVVDKILEFLRSGYPIKPLVCFMKNVLDNPSKRAIDELYTFLQHRNMPLTPSGTFFAYKGLKVDYYSVTSGKLKLLQGKTDENGFIYNGINEVIETQRNQVCDDKEIGCSTGLHAGSLEYATGFSQGKVVIVEINPADVVSVPSDCECQKLRTSKYIVVGEYELPLDDTYCNKYSDETDEDYDESSDEPYDNSGSQYEYDKGFRDGKAHSRKVMDTDDYNRGYKDGRYGIVKEDEDNDSDYNDGYEDGMADNVQDTNCSDEYYRGYEDGESDRQKLYDEGYEHGVNGNPADSDHKDNEAYCDGYSDGVETKKENEDTENEIEYTNGYKAGFYKQPYSSIVTESYKKGYMAGCNDFLNQQPFNPSKD